MFRYRLFMMIMLLFILDIILVIVMFRMLFGFVLLELILFLVDGMFNSMILLMLVCIVLVVVLCSDLWECWMMFGIDVIVCGLVSFFWMNIGRINLVGVRWVFLISCCIVVVWCRWCGWMVGKFD